VGPDDGGGTEGSVIALLDKLTRWAKVLKADVLALWFCRTHPDTPAGAKILAIVIAAYAFSPIDLIPDFIPVLGYLDDLVLVPLGIYLTLRMLPAHVIVDSRRKAEELMAARKTRPTNYLAGSCIGLVWAAMAWWAWRAWST
jgi:uncharacterized membrane protein YkvA (DUF1232 family)